jgi:hypothetical protein
MEARTRSLQSPVLTVQRLALWAGVGSLLLACGCRSRSDLVEAELRTKESHLREAREELQREQAYNCALQRELVTLRDNPLAKISPEEASQTYTLKSISLGRQTGGVNEDNLPGDEAIQVAVEPRDGDGHSVKAPGTLIVAALEVTPEGLKRPLCSWQIPPAALRKTWKSGLFSTGYVVILPWKAYPTQEKMRVVAQFVLADGRSFEADKDVTIKLIPPADRKPLPMDMPTAPDGAFPEIELPAPRNSTGPNLEGARRREVESPRDWPNTPSNALIRAISLKPPVPLK